jgi:hypothetical protein
MATRIDMFHDPWANLAAAIIATGEREHDTYFLDSEWAQDLRDMCSLDDSMYGGRGVDPRGGTMEGLGYASIS